MKRTHLFLAGVMMLAVVAFAAPPFTKILNLYVPGKVLIGTATESNSVTRAIVVDVDYDFASATIVCNDTPSQTATGVKKGDPCFVGVGPRDGGVQVTTANSVFDCYSDADNTAKLRHCAVGTAANPADAGYTLRFISSQ